MRKLAPPTTPVSSRGAGERVLYDAECLVVVDPWGVRHAQLGYTTTTLPLELDSVHVPEPGETWNVTLLVRGKTYFARLLNKVHPNSERATDSDSERGGRTALAVNIPSSWLNAAAAAGIPATEFVERHLENTYPAGNTHLEPSAVDRPERGPWSASTVQQVLETLSTEVNASNQLALISAYLECGPAPTSDALREFAGFGAAEDHEWQHALRAAKARITILSTRRLGLPSIFAPASRVMGERIHPIDPLFHQALLALPSSTIDLLPKRGDWQRDPSRIQFTRHTLERLSARGPVSMPDAVREIRSGNWRHEADGTVRVICSKVGRQYLLRQAGEVMVVLTVHTDLEFPTADDPGGEANTSRLLSIPGLPWALTVNHKQVIAWTPEFEGAVTQLKGRHLLVCLFDGLSSILARPTTLGESAPSGARKCVIGRRLYIEWTASNSDVRLTNLKIFEAPIPAVGSTVSFIHKGSLYQGVLREIAPTGMAVVETTARGAHRLWRLSAGNLRPLD